MAETDHDGSGTGLPSGHRDPRSAVEDLRRVGANPDFRYPVALSRSVRTGRVLATAFAGERIALYRGASGAVHALEDRCAHRQVPLSMGAVEGETLLCRYHAWAYRGDGRISRIPYLSKGDDRPPRGGRSSRLRGVRPRVRLPGRRRESSGHRAARLHITAVQDHDLLPDDALSLFVHARTHMHIGQAKVGILTASAVAALAGAVLPLTAPAGSGATTTPSPPNEDRPKGRTEDWCWTAARSPGPSPSA